MELTKPERDRLEAAAMVLHDRRHVITLGRTCTRCRRLAQSIAEVLWGTVERNNPPPAA